MEGKNHLYVIKKFKGSSFHPPSLFAETLNRFLLQNFSRLIYGDSLHVHSILRERFLTMETFELPEKFPI